MTKTHLASVLLLLCLAAAPARATQEYVLPTLFDVTGVAGDDVLNVRERPDAAAAVVGTLAPDATRVEVVEEMGGWGRVNADETSGWVNLRYLAYRTDVWQPGALPDQTRCFGTEPFWSLDLAADGARLSRPDVEERSLPLRAVLGNGVFRDPMRAIVAQGLTVTLIPQLCSDGMSDRLFGLRAEVVLDGDSPTLLSGCCSIRPD